MSDDEAGEHRIPTVENAMKILLCSDFSPASQKALEGAKALPWPDGTELCLLHTIDLAPFSPGLAVLQEAKRVAGELMASAAASLRRPGLKVETEILIGHTGTVIAEYAKNWHADLIVLGSRGRSKVAQLLLGSTALKVLRAAPCSAEIFRPTSETTKATPGMRILLATDGSTRSANAIQSVGARPWPDETRFRIISVAPEIPPIFDASACYTRPDQLAAEVEALETENRARAQEAVASAHALLYRMNVQRVDDAKTVCGDPRTAILEEARGWNADLIVLGSHGLRGFDRWMVGSVSEFVATHARCSVAMIRQ